MNTIKHHLKKRVKEVKLSFCSFSFSKVQQRYKQIEAIVLVFPFEKSLVKVLFDKKR